MTKQMANEHLFASLLEDSFSDADNSFENYSSKLKDALEKLTEKFEVEHLQQALQECLSSCPDDSLDEKLFSETLPLVHRFLSQILKQIPETISTNAEDATENIKRQLLMCQELLNVKEKSLERVSSFQKTSAMCFKFLIENVLLSIKLIFEHCRESKKLYETLFEAISEKLAILFRKAKTILSLFLATLESVIVFDTDKESETELLIKVIDLIGSLVTISHELDAKTFVDASKMFGKLAIMHELHIKRMKADCVTSHLVEMTKDATRMLSLLQDSLDKAEERKIKVIGHTLKILDRLFATYCSCLNNDTLLPIIELLLQMHRCSPSCLKETQNYSKLIELINIHISRGAEPFLNTVFEAPDFKQTFFEYGSQTRIDKLGYHLLIINIMKKLISMPYEQHCNWTLGSESIIDIALSNIDDIQEEICVGEVKLPGAHEIGERPRQASLYEATLVPICSLISQIPADGFHAIELILLKHLLSIRLWSSLLSSDVWCFIGRIGSSELCASHVKYLLKVYAAFTKRGNSFEVIVLENLIGRLYSLLSEDTRHDIVTELEDLENPFWLPLARFFPSKTKSFIQNRLACIIDDIPNAFLELQRQPTVQNWNRIMMLMPMIGKLDYAGEKHAIDMLSQIWNSIANTIEYCEGRQLDILSEFMLEFFSATKPKTIQDDTFFTILEAVLASFLCFSPHVKVMASHYLRNSINSFGNCGVKSSNALAELNCRLLEDENPWVRQEALESFDHVAHMCPNEDLVRTMAAIVTRKSLLNDFLPAYLSGTTYYELQDFSHVKFYLQYVTRNANNVCHVCCSYEDSQRDEKLAKLETQSVENSNKNASRNDLDGQVNKICDELNDISKKHDEISDHALQRLRSVCAKVLDLIEPLKRS
ncbi:FIGNL1-interacting regulator of recombination and mitosis isoform X2 [Megachile rotundata]|uniref:FIGNL1-interacting regulator of recombination and mitosis isoform X2 n=1 Tax=Megachile rotundata TaxID=143995 RepID=UPI0006152967|nr:PREDICTED: uncharacterized protein C1orf112-like isoform X2 [Megachile rotundata]